MTPTTTPMAESREDARPVGDPRGFIHPEEVALRIEAAAESREDGGAGLDLSDEAIERLARQLHTRQPYLHPWQIVAQIPWDDIESRPGRTLGDEVLVLGQGDYPMLRDVADQTRELQDRAAATLRALAALRRAPAPASDAAAVVEAARAQWTPEQIEALSEGLAGLSSSLGVGTPDKVDPLTIVKRIQDGIDIVMRPLVPAWQRYNRLRSIGVAPNGTLHLEQGLVLVGSNLDYWCDNNVAPSHACEFTELPAKAAKAALSAPTPPAASAGHGGERVGGDGLGLEEVERLAIECEDEALKWEADAREGQPSAISYCEWFGDLAHTLRTLAARACLVQAPPAEPASAMVSVEDVLRLYSTLSFGSPVGAGDGGTYTIRDVPYQQFADALTALSTGSPV